MFRQLGPTELLIILGIVILLFGVGRLSKIGSELGQGIRAFREGLRSDEEPEEPREEKTEA
jgi:sec-independent protein translocase protein TatA